MSSVGVLYRCGLRPAGRCHAALRFQRAARFQSDYVPHRTKLDQLLERRDAIYENLRDLRFEYRAGKYSEKDYEEIKQSLEMEAARVLADMDTLTGSTPTPATRQAAAERSSQLMKYRHSQIAIHRPASSLSRCLRWLSHPLHCAGTVTGTVRNGTTGKPAANVEDDSDPTAGRHAARGQHQNRCAGPIQVRQSRSSAPAPMLLRAVYRGVNYHEPVTPGKTTVDMQVFEPTDKPSAVASPRTPSSCSRMVPNLDVGEEYNITNKTQPPLAYYKADGSFLFTLPDGAHDESGLRRERRGHARDSDHHRQGQEPSKPSPTPFGPVRAACACLTKCPTPAIRPS